MFKFGLMTAILDGFTYEESIDLIADKGFNCAEIACWPSSKGKDRAFSGVCHIDCEKVISDSTYAKHIREYADSKGIKLSALAYYPNVLDGDKDKAKACLDHLYAVIEASAILEIYETNTFIGRNKDLTNEENFELVREVWPAILDFAKEKQVKIGIENCPMLFDALQWPGGENLMSNTENIRKIFEILPYDNLGLNFDPSHYVWQMMDYVGFVYEFKDKIFHIHFKDMQVIESKRSECGILAFPDDYTRPKLPGLGDVCWGKFIGALYDIGFRGCAVIEVEDEAFMDSREDIIESVVLSKRFLDQYIV